jgi:hypothetical protein
MKRDMWLGVLGAAIVFGFFLPWIDVGGHVKVSGWDFVREGSLAWHTRLLLAMCPIAGGALAVAGFTRARGAASAGIATGAAILGYVFYKLAWGFMKVTGIGLWMVLAAAALAIVVGLAARSDRGGSAQS